MGRVRRQASLRALFADYVELVLHLDIEIYRLLDRCLPDDVGVDGGMANG